jgi:PIN domain nuclease of toxin-antitoxin system
LNLLLDTHVALWAITDSPKLSQKARTLICAPRSTIWVSAASLWEIAIKRSLARSNMPVTSSEALELFEEAGYRILAIEAEHTTAVEQLPPHHQDPFDRILIAQALVTPMRLLTRDAALSKYGEMVVTV